MSAQSVILVLGAGPNVGKAVAKKFAQAGYAVALAARRAESGKTPEGYRSIKADLSSPSLVPSIFETVKSEFGRPPNVVVYNAATLTPPPDVNSLFSLPSENLVRDLNVNTISAYVAAQEAVKGFDELPKETTKAFIYTGNILNTKILPVPMIVSLGVGKSASAYWIGTADATYADKGYRFFYADQRKPDGSQMDMGVDGDAHADFFWQLASGETTVPWHATFVKDKGYVNFSGGRP